MLKFRDDEVYMCGEMRTKHMCKSVVLLDGV